MIRLPLIVVSVLFATPAVAAPNHYLGVTTTTLRGDAGMPAMNAACEADYGLARMCTETQIMTSVPALVPGANAWILPQASQIMSNNVWLSVGGSLVYTSLASYFACNAGAGTAAFTDSYGSTLSFNADGSFNAATSCNTTMAVACCGVG